MSPNPADFLSHLREQGYHSRSNKHSNALAEAIVRDLFEHCPAIRQASESRRLVYCLNFDLTGSGTWNVDLVLGEPALGFKEEGGGDKLLMATPAKVQIAIELKSVMTEHRKAIKNRKRDLEAHHEHVHEYSTDAIAGGVLVVNGSEEFQSPLRQERTTHRNVERLIEHCLSEARSISTRSASSSAGLDAKCVLVVDMDNVSLNETGYIEKHPAPRPGDSLHYDSFIRQMCEQFRTRFVHA
jgi:hypothetical protein